MNKTRNHLHKRRHNQLVIDISDTLKNAFGIQFLSYRRLLKDQDLFLLASDPKWEECSVNNRLLISRSLLKKIKSYNLSNFQAHFWENRIQEPLCQALYDHNLWHGMSIFKKYVNYTEIFSFCAHRDAPETINLYLKYPQILERCVFLFKEKAGSFMDEIIPQIKLPEETLHNSKDKDEAELLNEKINSFLEETKIHRYYLFNNQRIFFSKRQKECFYYLSIGKNCRETAELLGLSTRTIEMYARSIKQKLVFSKKEELMKINSML